MERVYQNIIATSHIEKKVFFAIIGTLFVLASFYAYFVNRTVMNVVARKDIQTQMTELSSNVSEFEFKYMKYKNTITLDYTRSLGFSDARNTIYISRGSGERRLTLRE